MQGAYSRRDATVGIALFLFFWALYLWTLSPGVQFEDTAEFALSLFSLGVSHPPGYPLYVLFGKLFDFLPFAGPAFCSNAASALTCAMGVAILFCAGRGFGFSTLASAIGAFALGISTTIWSQALISEVYSLKIFLDAALLWAIAVAWRGSGRHGLLAAFFLGLTAANHYVSFFAFLPVVAAFAIFRRTSLPRFASGFFAGTFAAVSFSLLYSTLPLRAAASPMLNWRNPDNFPAFFEHVRRIQFEQWEGQLRFHLPTLLKYVGNLIESMPSEFPPLLLFIAVFGLVFLLSEKWKIGTTLAWLALSQSVGLLLLVRFHYNEIGLSVVRVFYVGAYVIVALLVMAGADAIFAQLGNNRLKWPRTVLAVVLIFACAQPLASRLKINDARSDERVETFAKDLFGYLRRDTVLYLKGSHFNTPMMYVQSIRNVRPDVDTFDRTGNMLQKEVEAACPDCERDNPEVVTDKLFRLFENNRYQAFTTPRMRGGASTTYMMRGPFYYASDSPGCDPRDWTPEKYGFQPGTRERADYETRAIWSFTQARLAECDLLRSDHNSAFDRIKKAVDALPNSANVNLFAGQLLERYDFKNLAFAYYENALDLDPTFTDALVQMGELMIETQGDVNETDRNFIRAEKYFERALEISPDVLSARLALANVATLNRDWPTAEKHYKELLKETPENITLYNNLANLYIKQRRLNEARLLYKKALARAPESALTLLNYSSLLLDAGDLDLAQEMIEKHLEINPDSGYGHYNLGIAFQRRGDYNGAIIHYSTAVDTSPGLAQAWTNLVSTLVSAGRVDEARRTVERSPNPKREWQKFIKGLVTRGMVEDALKIVETTPGPPEAWTALIIVALQKGLVSDARAAVESMKTALHESHAELVDELDERVLAAEGRKE